MGLALERFLPCHCIPSTLYGEVPPVVDREHDALVFNPLLDVTTYIQSIVPHQLVAGGIRWDIAWSSGATTGQAVWGISLGRYEHAVTRVTDSPSSVFGPEYIGIGTPASPVQVTTIQMTGVSVQPHEFYRIRLRHLGSHASRTIAQPLLFWVLGAENLA